MVDQRHCDVSLSKPLYPLLSTGSIQEDLAEKLLTGMLNIKQTNKHG